MYLNRCHRVGEVYQQYSLKSRPVEKDLGEVPSYGGNAVID